MDDKEREKTAVFNRAPKANSETQEQRAREREAGSEVVEEATDNDETLRSAAASRWVKGEVDYYRCMDR